MPAFETWSHENLAKFAAEAYAKMQQQQDQIEHLQNDLKDAIISYQGECNWCGEQEALAQTQEPDDIASILACRDMLDAQPVSEVDRVIWPERTEQELFEDLATELFVVAQTSPADDGFLDTIERIESWLREHFSTPPQRTEQNFCSRCGKRTNDIHTCTPPYD